MRKIEEKQIDFRCQALEILLRRLFQYRHGAERLTMKTKCQATPWLRTLRASGEAGKSQKSIKKLQKKVIRYGLEDLMENGNEPLFQK